MNDMNDMLHNGILEILNNAFNDNTEESLAHRNIPPGINQLNSLTQADNGSSAQATTATTSANALWRVDYKASQDGRKSYVATVMLNKSDATVHDVINAINAAKNKGIKDFGDNWNCNFNSLHDGDKEIPQNAKPENYRGKYYLYARSYVQPIIVSAKGDLLQDREKVYVNLPASLYEGPVCLKFFPYNNRNTGISCSPEAFMVIKSAGCLTGDKALAFAKDVFSQYFEQ